MAKKESKDTTKSRTASKAKSKASPKTVSKKNTKTPPKKITQTKSQKVRKSGKKTIAQRQVAWKNGSTPNLIRWVLMVPLAVLWVLFTFFVAGYSFSALVCACLIGVLLFYNIMNWAVKKYPRPAKAVRRIFTICLCIGLLVVGITECFVIRASFGDPDESCEYMVVLGAKVRENGPSVSLMDRIRAAYDYMTAHPEVIAIVSGGKGADEPMTEAQCMYDNLVQMGIDSERIWMEDKATSTWENLHFALDLIEEKTGQRPTKIGLLSSEYHLFRASLFADACGVDAVGIPAATSRLSQKINHFMREVAGVWHYILLGGQYSD